MSFPFEWNELADQPHNVAPRSERTRHHLRRWRTYVSLLWWNLLRGGPALARYRRYKTSMFRRPVALGREMFGLAVSPRPGRNEEVAALLAETGVRETLVRVPSWEKDKLDEYADFARFLRGRGFGLTFALLQRREDVLDAAGWAGFLEACFARLSPFGRDFEIGHAWNRTKWGVWDYTEYLALAKPAFALRGKYDVRLVGPAVIDFEFHLYPPTLRRLPFDVSSSLLYVDRVGAPENAQYGYTAAMKVALFRAYTEASARPRRTLPCWITETNWPLAGVGPWSPASGKPNVTEEEQADYLVRYYIICLAGGMVERVYWWQLVAPGYGLIDSRADVWRRRPSFAALRTMVAELAGAEFRGKDGATRGAEIYRFAKDGRELAVCWTTGAPVAFDFGRRIARVLDRDGVGGASAAGAGVDAPSGRITIERSPKYVFFG